MEQACAPVVGAPAWSAVPGRHPPAPAPDALAAPSLCAATHGAIPARQPSPVPSPAPTPSPRSTCVSAGEVHQMVRGYLLHYGYAQSLAAFDVAAGMVGAQAAEAEAAAQAGTVGTAAPPAPQHQQQQSG